MQNTIFNEDIVNLIDWMPCIDKLYISKFENVSLRAICIDLTVEDS